jgi:L-ascorbate metabolism protein UlaG (beta-lactamase superfamily)
MASATRAARKERRVTHTIGITRTARVSHQPLLTKFVSQHEPFGRRVAPGTLWRLNQVRARVTTAMTSSPAPVEIQSRLELSVPGCAVPATSPQCHETDVSEGKRRVRAGMTTSSSGTADSASRRSADTLTFIGNATTLLRVGSFTVLTDPNFIRRGQLAYLGRGLWTRRLTDPAIGIKEVPALDAIVLSHLHGDHWDRVARAGLDRKPPLVTTKHAARRLKLRGFTTQGLTTWNSSWLTKSTERLRIVSLPAVHARGPLRKVLPPVMGSLLEHQVEGQVRLRVYLSGDTLTGDHLDAVHERYPDIDVAVMHLGGTRVLASTVTMDAPQGVDFLHRVQPRSAIPVHYDDYKVFKSPLSAFVEAVRAADLDRVVRPVRRGETVTLV